MTKKAMKEKCQEILYKYPYGIGIAGEDREFLEKIFANHPSWDEKRGCGIRAIRIRNNPTYRHNREFYLERTDGTTTAISFHKCSQKETPKFIFATACRKAIEPDIVAFKCNYPHIDFKEYVIHHGGDMDFDTIVLQYIEDGQIDITKVEYLPDTDQMFGWHFLPAMAKDFRQYHAQRAKLEIMPLSEHRHLHRERQIAKNKEIEMDLPWPKADLKLTQTKWDSELTGVILEDAQFVDGVNYLVPEVAMLNLLEECAKLETKVDELEGQLIEMHRNFKYFE